MNNVRSPQGAEMSSRDRLGGIIHTYQKYDPVNLPGPSTPPPDLVTPAFEHWLYHGSQRRLSEEELARAVHIDPSQIRGLGPSLESLRAILEERKRRILSTYETEQVQGEAHQTFHDLAGRMRRAGKINRPFRESVRAGPLH